MAVDAIFVTILLRHPQLPVHDEQNADHYPLTGNNLFFLIKAILKLSYYGIRSLIERTLMNLPNFACQGHTAGSVACSCRNKHGTYDENDSVNLVKTIIPKH